MKMFINKKSRSLMVILVLLVSFQILGGAQNQVTTILAGQGFVINRENQFIVFRDATDPGDFWGMAIDLDRNNVSFVAGAAGGNVGIGLNEPITKLTIATSTDNDGIWLGNPNNFKAVSLLTNLGEGAWNSLTQTGDHMLLWTGDAIDNADAGLVIAPWSSQASGARFSPNGDLNIAGDLRVQGDLQVEGVKSFVQAHPKDETKNIVYASLEGPEVGTYFRDQAELVDGETIIQLPEHFGLITAETGLTVQLTPIGKWLQLYVVELSPNQFKVAEANGQSGTFHFLIQGVRQGFENHEVIQAAN